MLDLEPFLLSSVPKSGTYLLHQLLSGMPGITSEHDSRKRFFTNSLNFEDYKDDHFRRLKELKRNEFGVGHIRYSKEYADMLEKLDMKHIFIYRDPRDVLVSMTYFIKDRWKDHPLHKDFNFKYHSNKERMISLLNGSNEWPPFQYYNQFYYKWLEEQRAFSVSFESLIQSEESRRITLLDIASYLWGASSTIPIEQMVEPMISNYNPFNSGTFRSGKIGSWQTEFDQELKEFFKTKAGELLVRFHFEKNNQW